MKTFFAEYKHEPIPLRDKQIKCNRHVFYGFISNKEHWQEKVLQSFIYLCDILYFFFKVGHATTAICPLSFQKKNPYLQPHLLLFPRLEQGKPMQKIK